VHKLKRSLILIILLELTIINLAALHFGALNQAQAQATTELYLDQESYTANRIGETFNINVNIRNLEASQRLIVAQFRVTYDDSLLEVADVVEGPFMQQFNNTAKPPYTIFLNFTRNDSDYGPNVLVGILLVPTPNATERRADWTNYPYGNGTLATITFEVIYRPVEPSPPATCVLNLTDTLLVADIPHEYNVTQIPHIATGATYYALPIPIPTLSLEPDYYNATLLGESFNVSVNIENLDPDWRMIFAQFRVAYDGTLVNPTNTYEGPFLQQFPNSGKPPYTFFIQFYRNESYYGPNVLVGILLMPNATGTTWATWTNYPYGNGTLATITFQIVGQPSYPQTSITSDLTLIDTLLVEHLNLTAVAPIPHNLINGSYEISPLTFSYGPAQPSAGEITVLKVAQPRNHSPITYSWDFGDGTAMNTSEPTVAHAFATPGEYNVTLTCTLYTYPAPVMSYMYTAYTATTVQTITVAYYRPLDVTAQVGSLHFKGETAEFTILTTDSGKRVNATSLEAELYSNGILITDLSSAVQTVGTGLYNIPYYIPADASPGEYTMLIDAEYYGANGATIATFTISPTLSAWNDSIAQITTIKNGVATITNGVATLTLNLNAINASLAGLIQNNGQVLATINTSVGTLTTKLDTIDAKIGNVNGNTVTVYSTLGNITTKLDGIQSTATTTLYVASLISAIAVVLALAILFFVRKK
jgi:hypothetical protein